MLGDIFDVWLGNHDLKNFHGVFAACQEASQYCPIYFMPGNHDFLLQKSLCKNYGITWLPDPYLSRHHGKKLLLTHGDLLCTEDIGYQNMRRVIQNPITIKLFQCLPQRLKQHIAYWLKQQSKNQCQNKTQQQLAIPKNTLQNWQAYYQWDALIHGHIHQMLTDISFARYSLGDWHDHSCILSLADGQFSFQ